MLFRHCIAVQKPLAPEYVLPDHVFLNRLAGRFEALSSSMLGLCIVALATSCGGDGIIQPPPSSVLEFEQRVEDRAHRLHGLQTALAAAVGHDAVVVGLGALAGPAPSRHLYSRVTPMVITAAVVYAWLRHIPNSDRFGGLFLRGEMAQADGYVSAALRDTCTSRRSAPVSSHT